MAGRRGDFRRACAVYGVALNTTIYNVIEEDWCDRVFGLLSMVATLSGGLGLFIILPVFKDLRGVAGLACLPLSLVAPVALAFMPEVKAVRRKVSVARTVIQKLRGIGMC